MPRCGGYVAEFERIEVVQAVLRLAYLTDKVFSGKLKKWSTANMYAAYWVARSAHS